MTQHITISPAPGVWVARADGAVIAESRKALELEETGYAATIYFPREDVAMAFLEPARTRTHCPHKGDAEYFNIVSPGGLIAESCWSYGTPRDAVAAIAGHVAFDAQKVTVERL